MRRFAQLVSFSHMTMLVPLFSTCYDAQTKQKAEVEKDLLAP